MLSLLGEVKGTLREYIFTHTFSLFGLVSLFIHFHCDAKKELYKKNHFAIDVDTFFIIWVLFHCDAKKSYIKKITLLLTLILILLVERDNLKKSFMGKNHCVIRLFKH